MIAIDTYLLLVWNNFSWSIQAVFIKTTSRRKDCCLCQISHLSNSIEQNLCGKIFITGIHNLDNNVTRLFVFLCTGTNCLSVYISKRSLLHQFAINISLNRERGYFQTDVIPTSWLD